MDFHLILKQVVDNHVPDLHLKIGRAPIVRLTNGELFVSDKVAPFTSQEIVQIAQEVAGPEKYARFEKDKEVDFSYSVAGIGRFRVNLYHDSDGVALAFRSIPEAIPTFEQLMLPSILGELALKPRGLVLVTGPTGSGKS